MDPAEEQLALLLDLDARHDDLLRRLDELDHQVTNALAEYQSLLGGGPNSAQRNGFPQHVSADSHSGGVATLSVVVPEPETLPTPQEPTIEKKSE